MTTPHEQFDGRNENRMGNTVDSARFAGWFSSARVPSGGALRDYYERIRVATNDYFRTHP